MLSSTIYMITYITQPIASTVFVMIHMMYIITYSTYNITYTYITERLLRYLEYGVRARFSAKSDQ